MASEVDRVSNCRTHLLQLVPSHYPLPDFSDDEEKYEASEDEAGHEEAVFEVHRNDAQRCHLSSKLSTLETFANEVQKALKCHSVCVICASKILSVT